MPKVCGKNLFRATHLRLLGRLMVVCTLLATSVLETFAAPSQPAPDTDATRSIRAGQSTATKSAAVDPVPLEQALQTLGDLSLQDVTIEKALFTIGASWRVNIVVGKDVKGTVSCIYRQAPLREVLDAILLANGYSYRAVGESLVVQKSQDVGSANPLFESAAITITHSDVDEILAGAQLLLSKQGQIKAMTSARSILVVDYADRVASIRDFVAQMDAASAATTGGIPAESYQRMQVSYFHTQYIPVDNAKKPITAVLSQGGRVATMPTENRLVVVDYASNIAMVRKVLAKIDRPVPQVRITALIYDISLQDVEQLGLNWNSVGKGRSLDADGNPNQLISLDTTTLAPIAAGQPGGTTTVQSLTTNFDISTVGVFLQNANDARLLANPNVTVMENETAVMSSVQQIPYQQITQSELGGQLGTTAFKDVGITLNVTPSVAADGTIKMIVNQEFSRLAGFTENDNQPIIDTRIANTTVRVGNQKTFVIGGLRQRSDTGEFNGIPFLKDVRLIGPLFRSRDTTVRESELLVFLMPQIVSYEEPATHREYLAQETVACRLDRVPMAEGCPAPCGTGCGNESTNGTMFDQPVALPPVDGMSQPYLPVTQGGSQQSEQSTGVTFRKAFGDRYRAAGVVDQQGYVIEEDGSTEEPPKVEKTASNPLTRLLRSRR